MNRDDFEINTVGEENTNKGEKNKNGGVHSC